MGRANALIEFRYEIEATPVCGFREFDCAAQRFGRFRGRRGHSATVANRSFMSQRGRSASATSGRLFFLVGVFNIE
jgi:hypothetical protein